VADALWWRSLSLACSRKTTATNATSTTPDLTTGLQRFPSQHTASMPMSAQLHLRLRANIAVLLTRHLYLRQPVSLTSCWWQSTATAATRNPLFVTDSHTREHSCSC
jgi:hypothetical protein